MCRHPRVEMFRMDDVGRRRPASLKSCNALMRRPSTPSVVGFIFRLLHRCDYVLRVRFTNTACTVEKLRTRGSRPLRAPVSSTRPRFLRAAIAVPSVQTHPRWIQRLANALQNRSESPPSAATLLRAAQGMSTVVSRDRVYARTRQAERKRMPRRFARA